MSEKLVKGTIFVRERGLLYRFMFNPAEIEETKAMAYPSETPAGASNPIYNFASGGERLITFTLYLDGDRGRSDNRPKPQFSNQLVGERNVNQASRSDATALLNTNGGGTSSGSTSMSILDEVRLLQSLLYPSKYGRTPREVYPYLCIFTFGGTYPATPVIVKKADPKFNYFVTNLDPVRATVSMQLGIVKPAYETADEYAPTAQEAVAAAAAATAQSMVQRGIAGMGGVGAPAALGFAAGTVAGGAGGFLGGAASGIAGLAGRRF